MTYSVRVLVRRFALTRRYATASMEVASREVGIVGLFERDTLVGVGEAAPLPGYSVETLHSAVSSLRGFDARGLVAAVATGDLERARGATESLPASARAAIEVATIDAVARGRGMTFAAMFGDATSVSRKPAWLADHGASVDTGPEGTGAIKLKIGRDLGAELERATRLRERHPSAELRLDANRSLDPERDRDALVAFARLGVSFVEEPFASLEASLGCAVPKVALDESLRDLPLDAIERCATSENLSALVLKPMSLGFLRALAGVEIAARHGLRAIVSHGFEGPVGFEANAALASVADEPHPGLDPDYGPIDAGISPPSLVGGLLVPSRSIGLGLVPQVASWF